MMSYGVRPMRKAWERVRDWPLLGRLGLVVLVILFGAAGVSVISDARSHDSGTDRVGVVPPTTTSLPETGDRPCAGVRMTAGERDVDAAPVGTTFCLSGIHNWTLTPSVATPSSARRSSTVGTARRRNRRRRRSNVTLVDLEVRNYRAGDQKAAISAHGTTGWVFRNLQVHDNGTSAGGTGANLGVDSRVFGGRYYNNRTLGIAAVGRGRLGHRRRRDRPQQLHRRQLHAAEHQLRLRRRRCEVDRRPTTVENSRIHDNACKGLWADLNGDDATITNNHVYGNWDEGIFIEISSGAVVTGNTVSGNGLHNHNGSGSGCPWLWGGGITFASSDHGEIADNALSGNCNGITGTSRTGPGPSRPAGEPELHDNAVIGPGGRSGVGPSNGADLTTRSIVFARQFFHEQGVLRPGVRRLRRGSPVVPGARYILERSFSWMLGDRADGVSPPPTGAAVQRPAPEAGFFEDARGVLRHVQWRCMTGSNGRVAARGRGWPTDDVAS